MKRLKRKKHVQRKSEGNLFVLLLVLSLWVLKSSCKIIISFLSTLHADPKRIERWAFNEVCARRHFRKKVLYRQQRENGWKSVPTIQNWFEHNKFSFIRTTKFLFQQFAFTCHDMKFKPPKIDSLLKISWRVFLWILWHFLHNAIQSELYNLPPQLTSVWIWPNEYGA
jgi:hypothetical protein